MNSTAIVVGVPRDLQNGRVRILIDERCQTEMKYFQSIFTICEWSMKYFNWQHKNYN